MCMYVEMSVCIALVMYYEARWLDNMARYTYVYVCVCVDIQHDLRTEYPC